MAADSPVLFEYLIGGGVWTLTAISAIGYVYARKARVFKGKATVKIDWEILATRTFASALSVSSIVLLVTKLSPSGGTELMFITVGMVILLGIVVGNLKQKLDSFVLPSQQTGADAAYSKERDDFRNGVVHEIWGIMQNMGTRQNYSNITYPQWASKIGKSKENLLGNEDYLLLKGLYDRFQERNDFFRSRQSYPWPDLERLNRSCFDSFVEVHKRIRWISKAIPSTQIDDLLSQAKRNSLI